MHKKEVGRPIVLDGVHHRSIIAVADGISQARFLRLQLIGKFATRAFEIIVLTRRRCEGCEDNPVETQSAGLHIRVSINQQIDLDQLAELIDPSKPMADKLPDGVTERIFHETKFVFLSCAQVDRTSVVHTTIDASFESAWERAPSRTRIATTHVVRCETEIFRVKQG